MNTAQLWTVILSLGAGSFLLRFSFLGFIGNRPMPEWLLRHLRYTAVAILPALVAPLIVWSDGPGTEPDLGQIIAALCALFFGWRTKNVFVAIFAGASVMALWVIFVA
ncbi:MAG: AzlD domain-containing protein [Paracoccaceae bacterium]